MESHPLEPNQSWKPKRSAKERRGKSAWLGPLALGLGLLCWVLPIGSEVAAATAIGCGIGSIATRREFRIDWTAVAGICAGAGQLYFALMLFALEVSGK